MILDIKQLIAEGKKGDFIEVYANGEVLSTGVGEPGSKIFSGYLVETYANAVVIAEERRNAIEYPKIIWLEGPRQSFDLSTKNKFLIYKRQ